jgi:hypothetical protein
MSERRLWNSASWRQLSPAMKEEIRFAKNEDSFLRQGTGDKAAQS